MKIVIPVGFDYFKGYSITAAKYFEITPTSILDSKWQLLQYLIKYYNDKGDLANSTNDYLVLIKLI